MGGVGVLIGAVGFAQCQSICPMSVTHAKSLCLKILRDISAIVLS